MNTKKLLLMSALAAAALCDGVKAETTITLKPLPAETNNFNRDKIFSPDMKQVLQIRGIGKMSYAYLNGKRGKECDGIISPCFSSDGKRTAYVAVNGAKRTAVIDGIADPEYDSITDFKFSADGSSLVYMAIQNVPNEPSLCLIVLHRPGGATVFTNTFWAREGSLTISPDGKRVGYFIEGRVFLDGKDLGDGRSGDPIVFSPDGSKAAWCANGDNIQDFCMSINGVLGPKMEYVGNTPVFSPDGMRVAYGAGTHDRKNVMVLDGKMVDAFDGAFSDPELVFSPDSKRFAFVAMHNGKYAVVTDGNCSEDYDMIPEAPIFSRDSKHCMFKPNYNNNCLVIVDGVKMREGGYVENLQFSPDGKHVGYTASRENQGCKVYCDGKVVTPTYEKPLSGNPSCFGFSPSGTLCYAAMDGDGLHVNIGGKRTSLPKGDVFLDDYSRIVFDGENRFHTIVGCGSNNSGSETYAVMTVVY